MFTPAGVTPAQATAPVTDAAAFVQRFRTFWASPQTVPLSTLLTSDVRLVQPLTRAIIGLSAAEGWRRRLFTAMPSLRSHVDDWSASGDTLFIAFRMCAVEPSFQLKWPVVDRFRLRSGLACERITYFDSLLLLRQVARQPRTWLRFMHWASSEWRADTGKSPG